jgi:hypothetical protein
MDSQNGPSENDPQQRDASGAANAATLQPARRPHAEVDPGSNAPKTNKRKGSKRLKYNVRACAECQKRKIKVSLQLVLPTMLADRLRSVMVAILTGLAGLVVGERKPVARKKGTSEVS